MIQNIQITNFKCFKKIALPARSLNILTGTNGMGKSSLIQLLLILRQSYLNSGKKPDLRYISLNGAFAEIGCYEDAIYRDFEKKEPFIKIQIKFSDKKASWKTDNYENEEDVRLSVKIRNVNLKLFSEESLFKPKCFQFLQAERIGPRDSFDADNYKLNEKEFGKDGRYAQHYFIENRTKEIPIKTLSHPDESVLSLEYQMNAWLSEISPNVRIKSNFDMMDKTRIIPLFSYPSAGFERKPFKAKNVGFGISYVFSVVLSVLTANPGDLIIIENPESHLHPKGQTKLAELICLAAAGGVQFFIETHSDHIINGIRISARQYELNKQWGINPEEVHIFYFYRESNEQATEASLIKLDKKAQLYQSINGKRNPELPYGFFDEFGNSLAKLI
jgi:predicted ATPase